MKRPILFGVLLVAIVFCYCFWGLAPKKQVVERQTEVSKAPSFIASTVVPMAHPSSVALLAIPVRPAQPLTNDWRRIFDSPDVMKTVSDIRKNGTKDEKYWALQLFGVCASVAAKKSSTISLDDAASQPEPDNPKEAQVAVEKRQAADLLMKRCKGVSQMTVDERNALKQEFREGDSGNTSVLGQLNELIYSDDDRWSTEQLKMVTEALYSGDPLLQRDALNAVMHGIDRDAPGGNERTKAFNLAFAQDYLDRPLSDFERLSACESMGRCASNWDTFVPQQSSDPAVARLADKYRAAMQNHVDAAGILAIR